MDGGLGMCFGTGAVTAKDLAPAAADALAVPAVDLAPMGARMPSGAAGGPNRPALKS